MCNIESGITIDGRATVSALSCCRSLAMCSFCWCGLMTAFSRIELARDRIPDDRIEPVDDMQTAARMLAAGNRSECRSNADEATDDREECQHSQRHPHRGGRFMRNVRTVAAAVSVCGDVMRYIFVYWSDMLAGFVSRAIS